MHYPFNGEREKDLHLEQYAAHLFQVCFKTFVSYTRAAGMFIKIE